MKFAKLVSFLCITLWLCANSASAQTLISPPESAKILVNGSNGVLLEWPGSPTARYFVQVYAGQVAAVEQEVTGTSVVVPLRAGLGYQWKVSRIDKGGYQPVVSSRNFQVLADPEFVFEGRAAVSPYDSRRVTYGAPGSSGGNGPNLKASLRTVGPYVSLDITGAPITRNFVIAPGASPITLISRGGRGGDGTRGVPGQDAVFDYQTGYIYPAGSGGPGGDAGDGGAGGSITAAFADESNLDPNSFLKLVSQGGQPGEPGEGGAGGRSVAIPAQWSRRQLPQGYGYGNTYVIANGRSGRPGRPGQQGPAGQIFVR